jgi:RNA 3'-terminal phosphate cyclase (ATP)
MSMVSVPTSDKNPVVIDGAHGEGGGQILRTAVTLSVITGRPVTLVNIRSGRRKPGLAAQHLTAIRAAGRLCAATISGDALGALTLEFAPQTPARAGLYRFDVAEARQGGSAGAATLVMQTILLPLALTNSESTVIIRGGTHMMASPSFDYASEVWLPMLGAMGVAARLELTQSGWFPVGQGEIVARIAGSARRLQSISYHERGDLRRVWGHALTANLPAHVAQRMAGHAAALLEATGIIAHISTSCMTASSTGAALFLGAEYAKGRGGVTALGERGKPAESVADEAVAGLLAFHRSNAAIDAHLADQLIVPAAFAPGPSTFTTERVTRHLETNAWVVEQFGLARIEISQSESGLGMITVTPNRSSTGSLPLR